MKHRTCILVTHAVDLVSPKASLILRMEGGAIVSQTNNTVRAEHKTEDIETLFEQETTGDVQVGSSSSSMESPEMEKKESIEEKKERLKLVKDETQSEGAVSLLVYSQYFQAAGGLKILYIAMSIFFVAQLADIGELCRLYLASCTLV